ncbi:MAG: nitrogen fixation protein NifH [Chloroflexales bacterium]|nr:nitrogen fixation protein NifH [Chloroflexales bacterium]
MRIALYGKGGIGKSTIAANLAAAFAVRGRTVLQIGCDPKHDSTRLLLDGRRATTVLEYLRDTPPDQQRLADVVHRGYDGVACVEAGGPEPGVGCAGRGILSTFALLDRLGLDSTAFDVVLYDVLGDVVCGGFAVPLRVGYADVVCIVSSEEFMAIYAANNILRGVRNFEQAGTQVAGLILNSRGAHESPEGVRRFAQAVELPVLATVPRSDRFREAEQQGKTVVELAPADRVAAGFFALADTLLGQPSLWPARPLDDVGLEQVVLGKAWQAPDVAAPGQATSGREHKKPTAGVATLPAYGASDVAKLARGGAPPAASTPPASPSGAQFLSKSLLFREPLLGCAFSGAVGTVTHIQDAIVIAHGPRSCTHIACESLQSSGIRTLYREGITIPEQLTPNLLSTDMDEAASIYGGAASLGSALRRALDRRPRAIFLASTCPAGIIGDDLRQIAADAAAEAGTVPLIPLTTDGNMAGDYMQGVINACIEGAGALVDPRCPPEDDLVNIVAEKNIATNTEPNLREVARLLDQLGLRVNCRFVRRTSVEALRGLLRAPLNLLAYNDHLGRVLQAFLVERFGVTFAQQPFPVGFAETSDWLQELAAFFGRPQRAKAIIEQAHAQYARGIQQLRPGLAGRRLMIVTYNHDIDWVVEAALDAGMKLVKVGILNSIEDHGFRTRYNGQFAVETGYTPEQRDVDIERLAPHLLLASYTPAGAVLPLHCATIPMCPDVGFFSGLHLIRRWATLLKAPIYEGWRNDYALVASDHA